MPARYTHARPSAVANAQLSTELDRPQKAGVRLGAPVPPAAAHLVRLRAIHEEATRSRVGICYQTHRPTPQRWCSRSPTQTCNTAWPGAGTCLICNCAGCACRQVHNTTVFHRITVNHPAYHAICERKRRGHTGSSRLCSHMANRTKPSGAAGFSKFTEKDRTTLFGSLRIYSRPL